jgi:hypothetical protein
MDSRINASQVHSSKKSIALSCFVIVTLILIGCSGRRIEIRGRVVTYDYVKLDGIKLTYYVMNKIRDDNLQTGTAKIRADGEFIIRIRKQKQLPYWVFIKGVDVVPEVSVMNNSYEIVDNQETKIDMGNVYIYDYIRILGDYSDPVLLRDLRVQWESNIPDVDFYRVELLGQISISGVKGDSFSFKTVSPVLEKQGKHNIGELEVTNKSDRIEGPYFLDVEAVRLIDGKTVTVAGAAERVVTIIGD